MEKRAVAPLVLGGTGLVLAVAIGVLVVKVRAGAPSVAAGPGNLPHTSRPAAPAVSVDRPPRDTAEPSAPEAETPEAEGPARPPLPGESEAAAVEGQDPGAVAEKMVEANRLYDRGDYEGARGAAEDILRQQPTNVKMLRIAASSACILGDAAGARIFYDNLPEADQGQIARRCRRYGVEF
ncbi:MAG TPA: hypothetical protein VIG06_06495 [Kofleriaceae bacterium]|jgi:hypothetical protein